MDAIRIARGWFHIGASGFPEPQRHAHAPREISSKVPSMIAALSACRIFPVANMCMRAIGRSEQLGEPARLERDIVIQDRDPFRLRRLNPAIHGGRESKILSEAQHSRAVTFGELGGIVGRSVVCDDDLIERPRLIP